MHDLHLAKDSGPIVRNEDLPVPLLDHLVHPPWSEGRSDRRSYCLSGLDVTGPDVTAFGGSTDCCFARAGFELRHVTEWEREGRGGEKLEGGRLGMGVGKWSGRDML